MLPAEQHRHNTVPSLSPHSRSSHRRILHKYEHPGSKPIDHVLSDSDDSSVESSVASDTSSASWDWSSDDESNDHNNYHEDPDIHPINIYYGQEYNNYNPMDHLQDMQDLAFLRGVEQVRNDRWEHTRLDWNAHVTQLQHEGSFENEYLMSLRAHGKLIRILDPLLQQKEYNSRGPEPILVEHIVGNGLRIVSGGRRKCQRWIFGMCKDASYKAFIDFINANALNTEGMEYNLRTIQTKKYR
jgi:hypothetical protein